MIGPRAPEYALGVMSLKSLTTKAIDRCAGSPAKLVEAICTAVIELAATWPAATG